MTNGDLPGLEGSVLVSHLAQTRVIGADCGFKLVWQVCEALSSISKKLRSVNLAPFTLRDCCLLRTGPRRRQCEEDGHMVTGDCFIWSYRVNLEGVFLARYDQI